MTAAGYLFGVAVIALLPASIAYRRQRSFVTWWFFGLLIWPVALAISLTLPRSLCPHCRARINPGATVCAHCGRDAANLSDPLPSVPS